MSKITDAEVRMYRLGTGDCFAIKFMAGKKIHFKMLIDAGSWSGSTDKLTPYIENLKEYLEGYANVLVVTHEHKDHVHAFDVCRELFTGDDFSVGEVWMGWTENDKTQKVKQWKKEYGEKLKALTMAALKLEQATEEDAFIAQFEGSRNKDFALSARRHFAEVLRGFADLHASTDKNGEYKGGLTGMEVVKKHIKKDDTKFFIPGDIISDIEGADGIRIYVLGPPKLYNDVETEAGGKGESYEHNKVLKESGAFSAAVLNLAQDADNKIKTIPFDENFLVDFETTLHENIEGQQKIKEQYNAEPWRRIDYDWLYSAGSFALRMNGLTNNLSLAFAIEFEDSGRVMLFPGDAEYGSWASWHTIKWPDKGKDEKHFTEDLLNRTVFYKVAHHLSHNGTAQKLGLEMMTHKDLAAMATLDYDVINKGWKGTMPNRAIIKELLARTKGRLMIMNEENLFYDFNEEIPLSEKIRNARARMSKKEKEQFDSDHDPQDYYIQYTVRGT